MSLLFEKAVDVVGWFATGSRVICDPAPQDTDEDYVIYSPNPKTVRSQLESLGYTYSSESAEKYKQNSTDDFQAYNRFDAYRHPNNAHNLIVLRDPQDFKRWKVATLIAKELNVTDKSKRIMLFRAIRSGGSIFTDPKDVVL